MPIDIELLKTSIRALPALPAVVMEIIESMGQDNLSGEQLADKLLSDPVLTAKTLRLANSSFYGVSRQVSSVQEAVTILGLRAIRSMVISSALASSFQRDQCGSIDYDAFWRHAIGSALCARGIAKAIGMDPELAFMIGLLHDVGQLALVTVAPEAYGAVVQHQAAHGCPITQAEQAVLGVDHALIGGHVTTQWCFAPEVVAAVAQHHTPPETSTPTLIGVIHVADNMAHSLDLSRLPDDMVPLMNLVVWSSLKLKDEQCLAIFRDVDAQHEELCRSLLGAT
jgi:putative nucleotidyltransferase with HDIG domain